MPPPPKAPWFSFFLFPAFLLTAPVNAQVDHLKEIEMRRASRHNAQVRADEINNWKQNQNEMNRQRKNCNLDLTSAPVTTSSSRNRGRQVEQNIIVDGNIDMKCGR